MSRRCGAKPRMLVVLDKARLPPDAPTRLCYPSRPFLIARRGGTGPRFLVRPNPNHGRSSDVLFVSPENKPSNVLAICYRIRVVYFLVCAFVFQLKTEEC